MVCLQSAQGSNLIYDKFLMGNQKASEAKSDLRNPISCVANSCS
jgi:hypothetical protein